MRSPRENGRSERPHLFPRGGASRLFRFRFASAVALLAGATVVLHGCGGGDSGLPPGEDLLLGEGGGAEKGGGGTAGGLDEYEDQAEELLSAVRKAGGDEYFADEFQRARDRIEKASDLVLQGDLDGAKRQYRLAINSLKALKGRCEEVKATLARSEEARKKAETAKARADAAKAQENAPDVYKEALDLYNQAVADLKSKDAAKIRSAGGRFSQAEDLFAQAAQLAEQNALDRELALKEREAMLKYKELARENQADIKALTTWQRAESEELQAETLLKRGEFRFAAQSFKSAASQYTAALQQVLDEKKFQELLAKQQEQALEAQKLAEAEARRQIEAAQGAVQPATPAEGAPPVPPSGLPPAPVPGVGSGNPLGAPAIPCIQGIDVSLYAQELDEEDEAFLVDNLRQLSELAVYDPVSGAVLLDYSDGRKLKKEVIASPTTLKNMQFEDPILAGQEISKEAFFTFLGHTQGFVLFPVPLRYRVRVTWKFEIQTMKGTGDFGCIVNYNPKTKSYYRTSFIHLGRVSRGGRPRYAYKAGRFRQSANYWHTKLRPVNWVVEFQMPDPSKAGEGLEKSGLFSAVYDLGGEEEARHQLSLSEPDEGGLVGFIWNGVRFRMRDLQICGFLDKPLAVEILRKKLGIPKTGSSGEGEKEGKTGAGEDPTASGSGADDSKNGSDKGDDFDY